MEREGEKRERERKQGSGCCPVPGRAAARPWRPAAAGGGQQGTAGGVLGPRTERGREREKERREGGKGLAVACPAGGGSAWCRPSEREERERECDERERESLKEREGVCI